jgi:hypothetical protein
MSCRLPSSFEIVSGGHALPLSDRGDQRRREADGEDRIGGPAQTLALA